MAQKKERLRYEVDGLALDPRLAGWSPCRRVHMSDYLKTTIIKLIERPPSSLFDRRNRLTVHYEVLLRDGSKKDRRTQFERVLGPNLGSLEAVSSYLHSKAEPSSFVEFCTSARTPLHLGSTQEAEMFKRFCHYKMFLDRLQEWHPTTARERALKMLIRHRFRDLFELGMLAREIELIAAHEREAEQAQRSQLGAKKAAIVSAARRAAHAEAWHSNFAKWLQPIIEAESSHRLKPISLERIAILADLNWANKKDGFKGTYASQMAKPAFGTLLNLVKKLEKSGLLRRTKPPRGRKTSA